MPLLITTSAGRGYETADAETLQSAIYSLRGVGGTVWIWTDLELSRRVLLISNVTLDFLGHRVYLVDGRVAEPGGRFVEVFDASYAAVQNVVVIAQGLITGPAIMVRAAGMRWPTVGLRFENIHIECSVPPQIDPSSDYVAGLDGILLQVHPFGSIRGCTFHHLRLTQIRTAMTLSQFGTIGGAIRDNLISDVFADGFGKLIRFSSVPSAAETSRNLFHHVQGRAADYTQAGVENIAGSSNHFDHVSIHNWSGRSATAVEYDWHISRQARDTYICAHTLHNALNEGTGTLFDPLLPGVADPSPSRPSHLWSSIQDERSSPGAARPEPWILKPWH